MKFYKVLSLVLGILLCLVLMNLCAESCARHNINYTARTNEIDRRITDVMRVKEIVDNKFVAEIRKGKVHLGGCAITMDSPMYHCNACGFNWGNFHEMFNNKK